MSSWHGKSKGTPLGYRIFVWVLKNFGVLPAYFLLRFVVVYYFFFPGKHPGISIACITINLVMVN